MKPDFHEVKVLRQEETDDGKKYYMLQVSDTDGDENNDMDVELFNGFGIQSKVVNGNCIISIPIGGNNSCRTAIASNDYNVDLKLEEGDTAIYSKEGKDKVASAVKLTSDGKVSVANKDEDLKTIITDLITVIKDIKTATVTLGTDDVGTLVGNMGAPIAGALTIPEIALSTKSSQDLDNITDRLEKLLVASDVFEDNNSDDDSNSDDDNVLLPPQGRVISGEHIDFDTSSSGDLTSVEVPSERGVRQSRQAVDLDNQLTPNPHEVSGVHKPIDINKYTENEMKHLVTYTKGLEYIQKKEEYREITYQNPGDRPTNGWGNTYISNTQPIPSNPIVVDLKISEAFCRRVQTDDGTWQHQMPENDISNLYVNHTIYNIAHRNNGNGDRESNVKQAELDFMKNVKIIEWKLNNQYFLIPLPQNVFNALADMCFPLGEGIFGTNIGSIFKEKIITYYKSVDFLFKQMSSLPEQNKLDFYENTIKSYPAMIPSMKTAMDNLLKDTNRIKEILLDSDKTNIIEDSKKNYVIIDNDINDNRNKTFYEIKDHANYVRLGNDFNNILRSIENSKITTPNEFYYYKYPAKDTKKGIIDEGK